MTTKIKECFYDKFGKDGEILTFFSPGRINLIGEHIDYNGGCVFPCALTIGTYGVVRKREDNKIRCYSLNFEEKGIIETEIDDLKYEENHNWVNYVKGVIWAFEQKGHKIKNGFDFVCFGTIPNGSGLSSSASLEILISKILIDLNNINMDMIEASLISQFAENKFIGVNCGIMDQFAIAMGKRDNAIFLNTNTLDYKYAPLNLKGMKIVISNTNKKRELADSKYNERRGECEDSLKEIKKVKNIEALADLIPEEFEEIKDVIKNPIWQKRVKHVVYENDRTKKAYEFLQQDKIAQFGELLNISHKSLKEDYEVTGIELDTLVEISQKQEGVIGSRMTGAGFGGCTVSIVKEDFVDKFIENVGKGYQEKIGYNADFYVAEIGDAPKQI
ncbi:galactokinase [uncultured Tyzzerella sp.]|uniref:galactokinase n=1 Tax=uncultured Tyzzerella sp. TaxID=2321398 RepID=UPI002941EDF4|nr:galactokinase [uncultured Tyzzerella sp.]